MIFDLALSLQGREYLEGWQDCYSLTQQFYAKTLEIELTDYSRPTHWYLTSKFNFFEEKFSEEGFISIGDNPRNITVGDALVMKLGRPAVPNHIAVYVGRNKILHHLEGQKSRVEEYDLKWSSRVVRTIRHPEMERYIDKINPTVLTHLPYSVRNRYGVRRFD